MQNETYKIKYKLFFWPKWKEMVVTGHSLQEKNNRMDFFFPDGGILSVGMWNLFEFKLGEDWVEVTKKRMEQEAGGQAISLNTKKKNKAH